jgi:hypothetical protein
LELLEDRTAPAVFTVTSTLDDGSSGSLRWALSQANADTDPLSTINFSIATSGVQTISIGSQLPTIIHPVFIDGTTESGRKANDKDLMGANSGYDANLPIVLDGGAGQFDGLLITAGNSTVQGLKIQDFANGIHLTTNGNDVLVGNYITSSGSGAFLDNVPNNTIGGTTPAARNVFGSNFFGIHVEGSGASGNQVQGNYIGTDGSQVLNADFGVLVEDASNNVLGGNAPGEGNVIGANTRGIEIGGNFAPVSGNLVQGNYVGLNAAGTAVFPGLGQWGVVFAGYFTNNTIGGTSPSARNVISGWLGDVCLDFNGIGGNVGNVVQENYIGTDAAGVGLASSSTDTGVVAADGTMVLGNLISGVSTGVLLPQSGSVVRGNTIVFNPGPGVSVSGTGNAIEDNSIYGNTGLGIDNSGIGQPDPNWPGGPFTGTNAAYFPSLSLTQSGSTLTYNGILTGLSNTRYTVFFNNAYFAGAGSAAVKFITTDASGNANISVSITAPGFSSGQGPLPPNVQAFPPHSLGNYEQNYPILASASAGSSTLISGTLNGQASTTFTVDFYANPTADPSGFGQGQYYLGSRQVTTDVTGNVTFATDFSAADLAATQLPNGVLPAGWYVSATATDPGDNTSEFSADILATTSNALQPVLTPGATVSIVEANNDQAQDVLAAVNTLSALTPAATVNLQLSGKVGQVTVSAPPNLTLYINGVLTPPGTTIDPSVPALVVQAGDVVVTNVTFTESGDAPTILVTGGNLTLRNDIIQESTNFTDAAIAVTGGTVDLGTASSPGNNTINVNGTGQFVQNTTSNSIPAVGDTFENNGTALPAPLLSFTNLSASVNPSTLNQSITLTVSVRPNGSSITPTGSVDYFDTTTNTDLGSVVLSGGSASLTTSALSVGNHVIRASYGGDSNFLPSLALLTQQVHYTFSGFLAPLNSSIAMALNRTVPIKFQLTDYNNAFISSLSAVVSLQVLDVSGTNVLTNAGSTALRYDSTANQFIANWQTKGLAAGTYTVTLALADGTTYTESVTLSKNGSSAGLTTTAAGGTTTAVGALLGGDIDLYVDNTNGDLTADELARIQDAVTAANAVTTPYGVAVTEVTDPTLADVTLNMDTTSAVGGYADGVLGCTTDAGQITIITGWNFYAGSDVTQIGSGQYDFETVVEHELGHALGLGHSTDSTSVMYATLNTGTVNRSLTTADLNVADTDTTGACGLHAAVEVGRVSNPSYNEAGRDLFFAFAGNALVELPVVARSETQAEREGGVGDPRRTQPVDAVFAGANQSPVFAVRSQDGAADPLFNAENLDDYVAADFSWQES